MNMTATDASDERKAMTETRNGWGPAVPATSDSSEEPQTSQAEESAAEEIGGDETEHNSGTGDSPRINAEDEQELQADEEEVEEFGHEPESHQRPATVADEDDTGDVEEDGDEDEEDQRDGDVAEEFATSQAPGEHARSRHKLHLTEEETKQARQDRDTDNAAPTSAASNGNKSTRNRPQARSRQHECDADERDAHERDASYRDDVHKDAAYEGVGEQAPDRHESSSESSSYGSYGVGAFRRAVTGSLKKLPVAGKLFGSSNRSGASTGSQRNGSGPANAVPYDSGQSRDDQGIATKPSPQEVERRLALALRETSIDGFSKIAVGSPKGGVGKSSLAYAIGCAIANHTNIRVCLVDADPEFGATRSLVPRPVPYSIVELARDADDLQRLSDIRGYVAQNEQMRLDVVLNPSEMIHKARVVDLPAAYERIDEALSRFYDLVIYDMGIGFSHPQIQTVLGLSEELLLIGDSEVVPNDIFGDALSYIQGLGISLDDATLAISHRLPPTDESATTGLVKSEHAKKLRRVTEIPYDAHFSQLLNRRAFRVDALGLQTRLGVLTTAASCLEGLRTNTAGPNKKG